MVKLTRSTGSRFLIDLDLQLRYGKQWDPTNAIAMMQYMAKMNYGDNIDFELGNGLFFEIFLFALKACTSMPACTYVCLYVVVSHSIRCMNYFD